MWRSTGKESMAAIPESDLELVMARLLSLAFDFGFVEDSSKRCLDGLITLYGGERLAMAHEELFIPVFTSLEPVYGEGPVLEEARRHFDSLKSRFLQVFGHLPDSLKSID